MEFVTAESEELLAPESEEVLAVELVALESEEVLTPELVAPESEELLAPESLDSETTVPDSLPSDSEMTVPDSLSPGAFVCARCHLVHEDRESWNRSHSRLYPCVRCGLIHLDYWIISKVRWDDFDCAAALDAKRKRDELDAERPRELDAERERELDVKMEEGEQQDGGR
jgi:predicted RNA-binding Zn-ribbon protein involved in translation (DUF1610 family)